MADVHWLIDDWADNNLGGAPLYTSDYFEELYQFALQLIDKGKAYVDDMTRGMALSCGAICWRRPKPPRRSWCRAIAS